RVAERRRCDRAGWGRARARPGDEGAQRILAADLGFALVHSDAQVDLPELCDRYDGGAAVVRHVSSESLGAVGPAGCVARAGVRMRAVVGQSVQRILERGVWI